MRILVTRVILALSSALLGCQAKSAAERCTELRRDPALNGGDCHGVASQGAFITAKDGSGFRSEKTKSEFIVLQFESTKDADEARAKMILANALPAGKYVVTVGDKASQDEINAVKAVIKGW